MLFRNEEQILLMVALSLVVIFIDLFLHVQCCSREISNQHILFLVNFKYHIHYAENLRMPSKCSFKGLKLNTHSMPQGAEESNSTEISVKFTVSMHRL